MSARIRWFQTGSTLSIAMSRETLDQCVNYATLENQVAIQKGQAEMIEVNYDLLELADTAEAFPPVPDVFKGMPASDVGDAMNRLGLCNMTLKAQWKGAKAVGRAFTIWVAEGDNAAIHATINDIRPGDFVVINAGGTCNRAILGDKIAKMYQDRGAVGVVVDGCIRDAHGIEELQFPVWATGVTPAGPFKNGPGKSAIPVAVGGVSISRGDLVIADDDGIAVVPHQQIPRVERRIKELTNAVAS